VVLGELALDGRVRPVRGVLPAVLAAKVAGWKAVVVAMENLPEASLVDGIEVWGVRTLSQLQGWLSGSARLDERTSGVVPAAEPSADLPDVAAPCGSAELAFEGTHIPGTRASLPGGVDCEDRQFPDRHPVQILTCPGANPSIPTTAPSIWGLWLRIWAWAASTNSISTTTTNRLGARFEECPPLLARG
jgi:Subunit ChlI of Mg-chelatase